MCDLIGKYIWTNRNDFVLHNFYVITGKSRISCNDFTALTSLEPRVYGLCLNPRNPIQHCFVCFVLSTGWIWKTWHFRLWSGCWKDLWCSPWKPGSFDLIHVSGKEADWQCGKRGVASVCADRDFGQRGRRDVIAVWRAARRRDFFSSEGSRPHG